MRTLPIARRGQPKIKWSQRSFWLRVVTGGTGGAGALFFLKGRKRKTKIQERGKIS